jgi:Trypsin-like peptidase domain
MRVPHKPLTHWSALLLMFMFASSAQLLADDKEPITSMFDEGWLRMVFSIGSMTSPTNSQPIGTGFLLLTPSNHVVLVTAKHVIQARDGSINDKLAYRVNRKTGPSYLLRDMDVLPVLGGWLLSTNADVALRLISWEDESDFGALPLYVMLPQRSIQAGTPLGILGFPMGLRSEDHAVAILRKGVIARSDPGNLLADCFVFPGNSGGPAVYIPNVRFGEGIATPVHNEQKILGIVASNISYKEDAVSPQTLRTRTTFEENSGLCNIVPTDRIIELMDTPEFKRLDSVVHN